MEKRARRRDHGDAINITIQLGNQFGALCVTLGVECQLQTAGESGIACNTVDEGNTPGII